MSKDETPSRMSQSERDRRRASIGRAATEKVSKSEQLNFRIDEHSINELQALAMGKGMPVGTMIRDWVLERLSQEKLGCLDLAGRAIHVLDEIHVKLNNLFEGRVSEPVDQSYSNALTLSPLSVPELSSREQLRAWECLLTAQLRIVQLKIKEEKFSADS